MHILFPRLRSFGLERKKFLLSPNEQAWSSHKCNHAPGIKTKREKNASMQAMGSWFRTGPSYLYWCLPKMTLLCYETLAWVFGWPQWNLKGVVLKCCWLFLQFIADLVRKWRRGNWATALLSHEETHNERDEASSCKTMGTGWGYFC